MSAQRDEQNGRCGSTAGLPQIGHPFPLFRTLSSAIDREIASATGELKSEAPSGA